MTFDPKLPITSFNHPPCDACDLDVSGVPCTCFDWPTPEDDTERIMDLEAKIAAMNRETGESLALVGKVVMQMETERNDARKALVEERARSTKLLEALDMVSAKLVLATRQADAAIDEAILNQCLNCGRQFEEGEDLRHHLADGCATIDAAKEGA